MSDLARLFRLCGTGPKPLENFTSTALAIAIGHDDGPMKRALGSLVRGGICDHDEHTLSRILGALSNEGASLTAETQRPLFAQADLELGYLDLVLDVRDSGGSQLAAWVEVKVDAWESGNQLKVYRSHAARLSTPVAVVTLGHSRIRSDTAHLTWADLSQAIRAFPAPHYTWQSLDEFLTYQGIVKPPLPLHPIDDPGPYFDVIGGVNGRLRTLWPESGAALAWRDGTLRSALERGFKGQHDLTTTGGPLHYGLVQTANGWQWVLEVRTKNSERIPLRADAILRDAEFAGLGKDWQRYSDRKEVLARRLPLESTAVDYEILKWFDEGLRQLRDARILEPYLAGLAERERRAASRRALTGSEGQP